MNVVVAPFFQPCEPIRKIAEMSRLYLPITDCQENGLIGRQPQEDQRTQL